MCNAREWHYDQWSRCGHVLSGTKYRVSLSILYKKLWKVGKSLLVQLDIK